MQELKRKIEAHLSNAERESEIHKSDYWLGNLRAYDQTLSEINALLSAPTPAEPEPEKVIDKP